jgi:hypothetical protein
MGTREQGAETEENLWPKKEEERKPKEIRVMRSPIACTFADCF